MTIVVYICAATDAVLVHLFSRYTVYFLSFRNFLSYSGAFAFVLPFLVFCGVFYCDITVCAQTSPRPYWQQAVHYDIDVRLDDILHLVEGKIDLIYVNHSPDTLPFIWLHLYPNAYLNDQTAFAQQQLEAGSTRFYYAKAKKRGGIDSLSFKTKQGRSMRLEPDAQNPDMARLWLPNALKPNDTIQFSSPFRVKIPDSFSRLGHVGQSYQITQWYPKPAVYDHKGWHQMPYLDQGEFYSEYGSFEVRISLPTNYVVGATGDLQNEQERQWLDSLAQATNQIDTFGEKVDFPVSSTQYKTLYFKQNNIHDFAWFADKRFHVLKKDITLPASGRTVSAWAMFTNEEAQLWKEATRYMEQAVLFYSEKVGEYPYNQVTAVQSALSAGSGMEYPNITVIGQSGNATALEVVIVHELGHNWFYGQLGSNEREHPWMDEGMNSYYERRYMRKYHPNLSLADEAGGMVNPKIARLLGLHHLKADALLDLEYQLAARTHHDQAIEGHSAQYIPLNYGGIVYGKTANAMHLLENYIGQTNFDKMMQNYYQIFAFKHPYPEDFRRIAEGGTPKNLEWFFDELVPSNKKIDYKLKNIKYKKDTIANSIFDEVHIQQKLGAVRAPFSLSAYRKDTLLHTIWYDGFNGKMGVLFPSLNYDKLVLDAEQIIPELNRNNNTHQKHGLCKSGNRLQLKWLAGMEQPNKKQIFWTPAVGYNFYDKFMLGAAFYNTVLLAKKWEYQVAPLFAFGTKTFSGVGKLTRHFYTPKQAWLHEVETSIGARYLGEYDHNVYFSDTSGNTNLVSNNKAKYFRLQGQLTFHLKPKQARSPLSQSLALRSVYIDQPAFECPEGEQYNCTAAQPDIALYEVSYLLKNRRVIHPYSVKAALQAVNGNVLSLLTAKIKLTSDKSVRMGADLRFFAGAIWRNQGGIYARAEDPMLLTMSDRGAYDYAMDDVYLGRYEVVDLLAKQVGQRNGGFKLPLSVGYSDRFLFACNIKANIPYLPRRIPIKLYADLSVPITSKGFFDNVDDSWSGKLFLDAGLLVSIVPNMFEIYLPLLQNRHLREFSGVEQYKFHQKISFFLNLQSPEPRKLLRQTIGF